MQEFIYYCVNCEQTQTQAEAVNKKCFKCGSDDLHEHESLSYFDQTR